MAAPKKAQDRKYASWSEVEEGREKEATTPSGLRILIRPVNAERHALAGGFPAKLREIAMAATEGEGNQASVINQVIGMSDEGEEGEAKKEALAYVDGLVRQLWVNPEIPEDADLDQMLPADYEWSVNVALGETDYDGEGVRLWGREPLSRWTSFREEHGCPEDCEHCERVRDRFSNILLRSVGAVADRGSSNGASTR